MANDYIADDRKKVRMIDANAFLDRIKERHDDIMQDPIVDKATKWRESVCFGGVVNVLVKMPTVDAVEVRCKGCKHWLHVEEGFGDCTNPRFHLPGHADPTMNADDYCSCGERRNEG